MTHALRRVCAACAITNRVRAMCNIDDRGLRRHWHQRCTTWFTMKIQPLETLTADQLQTAHGGIPAAAQFIMQHESGGSTTAGHLHSMGRGDGTRGNQSSAFGAFQMIQAQRKHYMGADYQSTDFNKQYAAATHYVNDRYGGWDGAERFWKRHRWY